MEMCKLGSLEPAHIDMAGGKAKWLDKLVRAGFNVPAGFVLVNVKNKADFAAAGTYYARMFPNKEVAVRSSAKADDGTEYSYAGQFKTILGVKGSPALKDALKECLDFLDTAAEGYLGRMDKKDISMSIIVQQMINSDYAGVCFTSDPAEPQNMLIEVVRGLGEELVSGMAKSVRYSIPSSGINDADEIIGACEKNKMLPPKIIREIVKQAAEIKNLFQMHIDTQFLVKGDKVYWLQARPITVVAPCEIDEFDSTADLDGCVTTRCAVGEMLPDAVTPLSLSVAARALDFGHRKMLTAAGVKGLQPNSVIFSSRGHLFLDMNKLYNRTLTQCKAKREDIDMAVCGRVLDETDKTAEQKRRNIFSRLNNMRRFWGYILSRKGAVKKLVRLTDEFTINTAAQTASALYNEIDRARPALDTAAAYYTVTGAHYGTMSAASIRVLGEKLGGVEKGKAAFAEMLQGIKGVESDGIVSALRGVAKEILIGYPAAAEFDSVGINVYMEKASAAVKDARAQFMKDYGHRAMREFELRTPAWDGDKVAFNDYLLTAVKGGQEEIPETAAPDIKQRVKHYGFKGMQGFWLRYTVNQSREGVRNREIAKSKFVKILDAFKKAYAQLGVLLTAEGKLPDADAVYFLTHGELALVAGEGNANLVKKALQRRRLLPAQNELRFAPVYVGKPAPLPPPDLSETVKVLQGTPISRGTATGLARVVKTPEEAAALEKGEIMVAAYTDIAWAPYYFLADGLVTEVGSALSHGAVVAREYALPAVSGINGATALIRTGDKITIDGTTGSVIKHETAQENS